MAEIEWKKEQLFFSGDEYYASIANDIDRAQVNIEVECYIYDFDEIGKSLSKKLIEAAKRGVRVRVIVDGIGSAYSASALQSHFRDGGVEFKIFHPIFGSWFIPVFRTLNRRNHRKIWMIDGKIAYTGSYNVSNVHTHLVSHPWRDSGIRVESDDMEILRKSFESVWSNNKIWKKKIFYFEDVNRSPVARLNEGKNKRRIYYRELLLRIREAKKYICFGNAYFSPHFRLVLELCYSARRGVEVHVIVPRKSDVFFMPWVGSSYYFAMLKSGVKVHEYLPSVFHAKNYVIDDWMLIGSSNLNYRSLFNDLEVDFQITKSDNKKIFMREINRDIENSELVTYSSFDRIPWIRKIITQFILLFKSWI
jgi:cardiolipin synthase A/B